MAETGPTFKRSREAALALYHERGYHIEPHVIPDNLCDALIEAAKLLSSGRRGTFRPAMNPHRDSPLFLEVMGYPAIVDIIAALIGGNASGLQSEFFFTRPGTRGFARHQDNFFVEARDDAFASAWAALTDVNRENGAVYLYPGSHRLGRLPVRRLEVPADEGQDKNAYNEETVLPEGYRPVDAVIAKGTVLFLHAHLVHGSHMNKSQGFRYALLNTYIRSGEKFRAGATARRTEVRLMAGQRS